MHIDIRARSDFRDHLQSDELLSRKKNYAEASMKSWSRDGLETLFWNVSVSVSSQTENRSLSCLGLGPQRLVLQAYFQRQEFTEVCTGLI